MTTLKCKCGSFEASFASAPRVTLICQCHSCVSVITAIEAKDGFSGISMKSDEVSGGAAVAIYKSKNITVTKVDASKIGFMKVGEGGLKVRRYCTECGTILFNVRVSSVLYVKTYISSILLFLCLVLICLIYILNTFLSLKEMNKSWSGVNRNALINADGSTPFICSPAVPLNVQVNDSFDKDRVPEPKHGSVPIVMLVKFMPLVMGLVGDGMTVKELIPEDISKVEICPITWE